MRLLIKQIKKMAKSSLEVFWVDHVL